MANLIEKSFDNVWDLQKKVEQKSFFYIGTIGAYLAYTNSHFDSLFHKSLLVLAIIYLLTIMPITTSLFMRFMRYKKVIKSKNPYYYLWMSHIKETSKVKELLEIEYDIKISKIEYALLEQLHINSKIMRFKFYFHKLGNYTLVIIIILFAVLIPLYNCLKN